MPAFAKIQPKGTSGQITYTVDGDGTLLLSLDDLACAVGMPGHELRLLGRARAALEKRISSELAVSACAPWILEDREVWELQRWEPFVWWGSKYPGHLYPTDPGRWTSRDQRRSTMEFDTTGWRLDPSAVGEDGWSYGFVPQMLRSCRSDTLPLWRWVRWRRWVPDVPSADVRVRPTPWGDRSFCEAPVFAAVLWLLTGGSSCEDALVDLELQTRCWGQSTHVDAWRDELGVEDLRRPHSRSRRLSSSDFADPRSSWRRSLAALLAPLRVARTAAARVRPHVFARPLACAALLLALLWRAGWLWPLALRLASWSWMLMVVGGLLVVWLRLPAWFALLFSVVVTRFALHGHPLRTRALHVSPYLQARARPVARPVSSSHHPPPTHLAAVPPSSPQPESPRSVRHPRSSARRTRPPVLASRRPAPAPAHLSSAGRGGFTCACTPRTSASATRPDTRTSSSSRASTSTSRRPLG